MARLAKHGRLDTLALLLCAVAMSSVSFAAEEPEVLVQLDREEVFEGEQVRYQVFLNRFDHDTSPDLSEFIDFEIRLIGRTPVNSQRIVTVNGRTQRMVHRGPLYEYLLLPKKTGTLSLPAPRAQHDGQVYRGAVRTLRVIPAEKQDFAILDVSASRDEVYPMQPFDVSLTITVKPIPEPHADVNPLSLRTDPPVQLTVPWADDAQLANGLQPKSPAARWLQPLLSERGGLLINGEPSNRSLLGLSSGLGNSLLRDLFDDRRVAFMPKSQRNLRKDATGRRVNYWKFQLQRRFAATQVGEFNFGPVSLKGSFVARVNSGDVAEFQSVYALAKPVTVLVKAVPTAGRPNCYVGAVGEFASGVELSPNEAKVGDPLTLTLWLHGQGTLDNALAPDLASIDQISDRFKVYEATAETRGDRRIFTYSVRPRHATVAELPPIQMAYFDVQEEQFVTLTTEPIPVHISAADQMNSSEIAIAGPSSHSSGSLEIRAEGIFANVTDLPQLRNERVRPDRWFLSIASLAGLFVVIMLVKLGSDRMQTNEILQRRRRAAALARQRLREGAQELRDDRRRNGAELISAALTGLVADVLDLAEQGLTSSNAVSALKELNVERELIARVREVLKACDDARYSGLDTGLLNLPAEAESTLNDLIESLRMMKRLS